MIKAKGLGAWVTSTVYNIKELAERMTSADPDVAAAAIGSLGYTAPDQDMAVHGWVRIGTVTVEFTDVVDGDDLIANQIAALRAELDAERAKWLKLQRSFERRISELQSLPAPGVSHD